MWLENNGTGVECRRLAVTLAPEATALILTQTTSAAMIHSAMIEELCFSKRVRRGTEQCLDLKIIRSVLFSVRFTTRLCSYSCRTSCVTRSHTHRLYVL